MVVAIATISQFLKSTNIGVLIDADYSAAVTVNSTNNSSLASADCPHALAGAAPSGTQSSQILFITSKCSIDFNQMMT